MSYELVNRKTDGQQVFHAEFASSQIWKEGVKGWRLSFKLPEGASFELPGVGDIANNSFLDWSELTNLTLTKSLHDKEGTEGTEAIQKEAEWF